MRKPIVFIIDYPKKKGGMADWNRRYSLNAYYAGKHWKRRKADGDFFHAMTRQALQSAGIRKRIIKGPVAITFQWDDRLDIDNHAVMGKMIVDGLKGVLLEDDGPRFVRRVVHEFWGGGCIRVTLEPYRED